MRQADGHSFGGADRAPEISSPASREEAGRRESGGRLHARTGNRI